MPLPTQADLLGFDFGFGGTSFVDVAASSLLDPGAPEWSLGGTPLLFVTGSAADPAADRRVTALAAQVLVGNPSTADAMVSALRLMALRTNDDPAADRRITRLAVAVLRSCRRGDVARPAVQGSLVFNDTTVTPGLGEYAIAGYQGVGSRYSGWTGFPYFEGQVSGGYTLYAVEPVVGPTEVSLQVGFGAGGDLSALLRKWHNGLIAKYPGGLQKSLFNPQYDVADWPYPYRIRAETGDAGDINHHGPGGAGNFPVGMSATALSQETYGIAATYPFFYGKVNEDFTVNTAGLGVVRVHPDPDPEAQQWALPTFSVQQHMAVTYPNEFMNGSGLPNYTFHQVTAVLLNDGVAGHGSVLTASPKLTIQRQMGRGAYRVVPSSYRDWAVAEPDVPPVRYPLQGANDPLVEMYGVTYGSSKELWEALVANADLSPMNLDWPARYATMQYRSGAESEWWATIPHRWGPAATYHSDAESGELGLQFHTFSDGLYITKEGERRYSRYKTLLMTQYIGYQREVDYSGEAVSESLADRLVRAYVPTAYTGSIVPGSTWDATAVATVLVEYLDDTIEAEVGVWFTEQPEYPFAYLALTGDQAVAFFTRFFNEEHPELLAGAIEAWDAREAELAANTAIFLKACRISCANMHWDADDVDPTFYAGTVLPPVFFVEKLDSPSTHFNDPPGTPGVDEA